MQRSANLFCLAFIFCCLVLSCQNTETPASAVVEAPNLSSRNTNAALENRALESPDILAHIVGAPVGTARLLGTFTDQRFVVDTATIPASGIIKFEREQPYKPGLYFLVLPNNEYIQIILDLDQTLTLTTVAADLIGQMVVEGSVENELLYENLKYEPIYQQKMAPIQAEIKNTPSTAPEYKGIIQRRDELIAQREEHLKDLFDRAPAHSLFAAYKRAGQNPVIRDIYLENGEIDQKAQVYWYKMDFWNTVDFSDDRLLYTPVVSNMLKRYMTQLTNHHPDSIIGSTDHLLARVPLGTEAYKYIVNWVALEHEPTKTTLMDGEAVYVHMVQNYFTYDKAFWSDSTEVYSLQIRADEMAYSLVGQKGPNVKVPDPNGNIQELYDLKSPYLIVYLYNPDCEHCQEQTPKLVSNYNKWKAEGIDIYAIAIDTERERWVEYIAQTGMNFTNVHDPTNKSIYKTYYVNVTPELYVLNPDREIIGKNLNADQVEEVVNRDKAK